MVPKTHKFGAETHMQDAETHKASAETHKSVSETPKGHGEPDLNRTSIPTPLAVRIQQAGKRPRQELLQALILDLYSWRPLTARELAQNLGDRDVLDLTRSYLRPMGVAGRLAYSIQDMPRHPSQK